MYELLLRKEDICLNLLKYIFKQCAQTIACYIPYIYKDIFTMLNSESPQLKVTYMQLFKLLARIPTFISIEKYTLAAFS